MEVKGEAKSCVGLNILDVLAAERLLNEMVEQVANALDAESLRRVKEKLIEVKDKCFSEGNYPLGEMIIVHFAMTITLMQQMLKDCPTHIVTEENLNTAN